ncbi:hypothetical protein [Natronococcus jeotgali]|uniref:Uncharacterized protein n=1 Tax=Natronococcus jeotgali DSM 18795 TaxID=1227498 RepID=L9WTH9_9EURY|nr:hypothetical protein [Natronococcus jeotgali]ELY52760.1 hypothetical protein C492_19037 [Natronococcus jeotgali DSM 18795]
MKPQNATALEPGATGNTGPYAADRLVDEGATAIGTDVGDSGRIDAETRHLLSNESLAGQIDRTIGNKPEREE